MFIGLSPEISLETSNKYIDFSIFSCKEIIYTGVKMDIEMQIIKAYVKENNYVSQKLC